MQTVICYGDSNTWGYDPETKDRFRPDVRWMGVLADKLGDRFKVTEEGLNRKTIVWDDPVEGHKNGMSYLTPCLLTHKPLDLVTLMLGTNYLKARFAVPAADIARSTGRLCEIVMKSDVGLHGRHPKILLLASPPLGRLTEFADTFQGGREKSKHLGETYEIVAAERGVDFLDVATVLHTSDIDGIHFDADGHHHLGVAVANRVMQALH
jgi:lysophospholipase L1-like esterase